MSEQRNTAVATNPHCVPSPRNMTGSWLGDYWVAPQPWHAFGTKEFQQLFQNKSMLWLGDSTGRRAAMNLYNILSNHDATSVSRGPLEQNIDLNRRSTTEPCANPRFVEPLNWSKQICRTMPHNPQKDFAFVMKNCLYEVDSLLQKEMAQEHNMTTNMDVLVVALGIWHHVRGRDCIQADPEHRDAIQQAKGALDRLYQLLERRPNLTVVWRTSGFNAHGDPAIIHAMNNFAMDYIDNQGHEKRLTYVDWGGAVEPRSFGEERFQGDVKPHYGQQPRLVLAQMIGNVVEQQQSMQGCHTER